MALASIARLNVGLKRMGNLGAIVGQNGILTDNEGVAFCL